MGASCFGRASSCTPSGCNSKRTARFSASYRVIRCFWGLLVTTTFRSISAVPLARLLAWARGPSPPVGGASKRANKLSNDNSVDAMMLG